MRNSKDRRRRSRSKDKRKRRVTPFAAARKTSVFAFAVGALLVVCVWAWLQAHGVRGPWARAVESHGPGQEESGTTAGAERLEWLRARKQDLIAQIAMVDSELAPLIGGPKTSNHATPPMPDDGGAQLVDRLKMMAQYDSHECDGSFGNGLVDAWRRTGTECCGSGSGGLSGLMRSGSSLSSASSVRCHLMQQDNHHGSGDNLVHMTNVQLDLSDLRNRRAAKRVMQTYKNSNHNTQAYMPWQPGSVKGTCAPRAASWRKENFPGWNADWTTGAFESVDQLQCDRWVDHPVMVIQRDTFANLFHNSEDFVNAFLAMAILRKKPGEVQVLLTDLYPRGPFWPMWDKVFGVGQPTLTAWDVGLLYGDGKVCFRDLTIGIFGPAAPTTLARIVTRCFHTALVRAYADFVIRGLGLQGLTRYASPPSNKVVVTWMARRSSVQWPEATFCSEDGEGSFFTCDYFTHLGTRQLQRRVKNEAEVVRSLRQLESETFANGAVVEVRDVDYNLLSLEEQIKNDLETDVMVGPHGAGLFHIIFAPDRAHLIELQIDQTTARKHFNNLAKWSGHRYTARGSRNPVDVEGTQAMVRQAIGGMDLSKH